MATDGVVLIAALFVETGGAYFGLEGVDPWDRARDARRYPGPWPVVAHPPCERWCRLAKFIESRHPHMRVGDDDGCFAAALDAVRAWGGVLEHPAWSLAWPTFDLAIPPSSGWARALCGGWVCEVAQSAYGHRARKLTWLYGFGIRPRDLRWDKPVGEAVVACCDRRGDGTYWRRSDRPRLARGSSSSSPPAFRDLLLDLARDAIGMRTEFSACG